MKDTMHAPRWKRVLDGGRTWGSMDVSATRYGVTRYRLVVFPPGISADDRVLLRSWRTWPAWGMAACLTLEAVLVPIFGAGTAMTVSVAVLLGTGAVVMAMTGANRHRVRTLSVTRMAGTDDPSTRERFSELQSLAHQLAQADAGLAAGELSAVEHEAQVWQVYDQMAPVEPAR
jgi:hypothetical protein